jgi:hypothetical protein
VECREVRPIASWAREDNKDIKDNDKEEIKGKSPKGTDNYLFKIECPEIS